MATTPATIKDNATLVDFAVALTTPGDYYSFNVDIVNNGSINAMLADVLITGISTEQAVYLEQAITYSDGEPLTKKDALGVGKKETIKVLIKYKMDITESQLPTTTQTLNLSLKATYSQDDGTSIKRLPLASKVLFKDDTLESSRNSL